jgi:hypothetical protein
MVRQSVPEVEPDQTPEPNVPQEPEKVGRGSILVKTRPGHEFVSTLTQDDADFPHITSAGLLVTRDQANQIMAEAEAAGGVGYVTEVETD